jgi:hypothetical protein
MRLRILLTVIFALAAREPSNNNGCGPLMKKVLHP